MPAGRRKPPAQVRSTVQARMGDTRPPGLSTANSVWLVSAVTSQSLVTAYYYKKTQKTN
jgi:hypothetical protein